MKKFLLFIFFCLFSLVDLSAKEERYLEKKFTVDVESLNVRVSPSSNSVLVGTLKMGDEVNSTSSNDGWVRVGNAHITGWVYGKYLKEIPKSELPKYRREDNDLYRLTTHSFVSEWGIIKDIKSVEIANRKVIPIIIFVISLVLLIISGNDYFYSNTYEEKLEKKKSRVPLRISFCLVSFIGSLFILFYTINEESIFWFLRWSEHDKWWLYVIVIILFLLFLFMLVKNYLFLFSWALEDREYLDDEPTTLYAFLGALLTLISGLLLYFYHDRIDPTNIEKVIHYSVIVQVVYSALFIVVQLVNKKNIISAIVNLVLYSVVTYALISVLSIVLFHAIWITILIIVVAVCFIIYIAFCILGQIFSGGADNIVLDNGKKLTKKKGIFQDGSNYREDGLFGDEYTSKDGKNFKKKN